MKDVFQVYQCVLWFEYELFPTGFWVEGLVTSGWWWYFEVVLEKVGHQGLDLALTPACLALSPLWGHESSSSAPLCYDTLPHHGLMAMGPWTEPSQTISPNAPVLL
jgi:hypothetical protein